jgi:hypothetical protein
VNAFVGVSEIKQLNLSQLQEFRDWATTGNWGKFHSSHYDWWAFPINAPSSYGFKYCLTPEGLSALSQDEGFIASLRESAALLMLSWGWDILENELVENPQQEQRWANWPIRLAKCTRSLNLFGQDDFVQSARSFASFLESQGASFQYMGRNLLPEIMGGQRNR